MLITKLMKMIKEVVTETAQHKQVVVLIIDEANLMMLEV